MLSSTKKGEGPLSACAELVEVESKWYLVRSINSHFCAIAHFCKPI